MIYEAMELIKDELTAFLQTLNDVNSDSQPVVLGNVALLELEEGKALNEKVVISLINVQEEGTLKNLSSFRTEGGKVIYENQPVFLNLFLLVTANWLNNYDNAIKRLSHVIRFFQSRKNFTLLSSPVYAAMADADDPEVSKLNINLDLYDLSLEQINQLWGALGGKQVPFIMYKVRLVEEYQRHPSHSGAPIEEVHGHEELAN